MFDEFRHLSEDLFWSEPLGQHSWLPTIRMQSFGICIGLLIVYFYFMKHRV